MLSLSAPSPVCRGVFDVSLARRSLGKVGLNPLPLRIVNQTNMASRLYSSLVLRAAVLPLSRRAVVNLPVSRLQNLQEWNFNSLKLSKISLLFTE